MSILSSVLFTINRCFFYTTTLLIYIVDNSTSITFRFCIWSK
nr:MAG TPA: hypothetical protein [Caudoviricetes sp.]